MLGQAQGVRLRSATVQTLALALHELATNTLKHSALFQPDGRLMMRWRIKRGDDGAPRLHMDWQETGIRVPIGAGGEPPPTGYGRGLIVRALPYQLQAKSDCELKADHVRCTFTLPIPPFHGALDDA
jgi:two-component sensor histidine kinase